MRVFLLLLTAVISNTSAQQYSPSMSGEMLIRQYLGPPGQPNYPVNVEDSINRESARKYINGVKDSTVGTLWCPKYNISEVDFNVELIVELQKLPQRKREENAGRLILNQLTKQFSCKEKP